VKVQVEAFKKKQELNSKIEEVRQYKSSVNYKISKKTHLKEETVIQISAAREELKVSESTLFTYEEQLKTTKKESDRTVITKKIEEVKKEIETITFSITTFQKTIDTITSELTELTSGTTIKTKEEEIKNLQKEVTTITNQACTSLNKLPLVKAEVSTTTTDDGTTTTVTSGTTTTTSSTCSPGVISGVSISGNLGASSTTTSDISTQIIEK
jgi:chromosome segregation ATPase